MVTCKWEYTLVDTVISDWKGTTQDQVTQWLTELNQLGSQGWEMVTDTIIFAKGGGGNQWPYSRIQSGRSGLTGLLTLGDAPVGFREQA